MANMSYCRFENTYHDLRDCRDALAEQDISDLSESEQKYAKWLIEMCQDIATDYGDEA